MRQLLLALLPAVALHAFAAPPAPGAATLDLRPAATPIIAELVHRPADFVGRRVKIYGVVVGAEGGRFLLNDVSQMALAIMPPKHVTVVPLGSQLLVTGIVKMSGAGVMVDSEQLLPVQVVAGGGCC